MSENRAIEQRLSVLEQEVEGEKLVSRHILEQTRRNSADMATIKADIRELKADVAVLKADVATLKSDLRTLKTQFASFPALIAETMREVLRERDR